jgi:hypothetical protein
MFSAPGRQAMQTPRLTPEIPHHRLAGIDQQISAHSAVRARSDHVVAQATSQSVYQESARDTPPNDHDEFACRAAYARSSGTGAGPPADYDLCGSSRWLSASLARSLSIIAAPAACCRWRNRADSNRPPRRCHRHEDATRMPRGCLGPIKRLRAPTPGFADRQVASCRTGAPGSSPSSSLTCEMTPQERGRSSCAAQLRLAVAIRVARVSAIALRTTRSRLTSLTGGRSRAA